jgi:hypothetical protein
MNIPHCPEAQTEGILLPYKSYRKAIYKGTKKIQKEADIEPKNKEVE